MCNFIFLYDIFHIDKGDNYKSSPVCNYWRAEFPLRYQICWHNSMAEQTNVYLHLALWMVALCLCYTFANRSHSIVFHLWRRQFLWFHRLQMNHFESISMKGIISITCHNPSAKTTLQCLFSSNQNDDRQIVREHMIPCMDAIEMEMDIEVVCRHWNLNK